MNNYEICHEAKNIRNPNRRKDIIAFISWYRLKHGKAPSIREIGSAVGLSSTSTVAGYLYRMAKEGSLSIISENKYRRYTVSN